MGAKNGQQLSNLGLYAGLAVIGLGAAYWASLPASDIGDDKVTIASFAPNEVEELLFEQLDASGLNAQLTVTAVRTGENFWVSYKKAAAKPSPAAVASPGPSISPALAPTPEIAQPAVEERFLASKQLNDVLATLNPFKAERDLGIVDAKELGEYGLEAPKDSFSVKGAGKSLKLSLGKKSYGSRSRFARLDSDKGIRVLLVDDATLENLERANTRLYQRDLVDFELDDVTHASLEAGDKVKRFAHILRSKDGNLQWTDDADNAPAKPSYDAWMDKLSKLKVVSYATEEEAASLKAQPVFLKLTYEKGDKNGKVLGILSFTKSAGDKPDYWVLSDKRGVYAKVPAARVEPIEKDLPTILAP